MESMITFFSCVALFVTFKLITILFSAKKKAKLNLPPSPASLPILGHLHYIKKPLHHSLARLSGLHGPMLLLRLGIRPVLVVSSAPLAEECFTTNDHAFSNRPHLPSIAINCYNYTMLADANGQTWRDMRRMSTVEILAGNRLTYFSGIRNDEARALARNLLREYSAAKEIGFRKVVLRQRLFGLTLNVLTRMTLGKRYYGEGDGDDVARRFMELVEQVLSFSGATNVGDFLPAAIGWFALWRIRRRMTKIHSFRDAFMQALVEENRRRKTIAEEDAEDESRNSTSQKTVLDALLTLQKEQPDLYTDQFIKALILGLLTAGTDTSSNTMEWAISLLLNNPDKLEKARKEIDEKVREGRLIEESDLANLPYLHCVINETLRMYPAAPLLLPHEPMEDCNVGGYDVPRGTILLVNAYAIQRDPKLWPESTKFLPERFLLDAKVQGAKMLPFGMGRRRCPGEGLAMREVGLVLGTLVQCFEWRRVGAEEVDMEEGSGITLPKANPLQALFRPRASMVAALSML